MLRNKSGYRLILGKGPTSTTIPVNMLISPYIMYAHVDQMGKRPLAIKRKRRKMGLKHYVNLT